MRVPCRVFCVQLPSSSVIQPGRSQSCQRMVTSQSMDLYLTKISSWPTQLRIFLQVSEILPSSNLERFRLHIWLTNRLSNLNLNLAPKLPAGKDKDYLKKKNYGKVPKYVTKIKGEIEDEYNLVREMQIEEQNERDR